jgi:hypothetical protein
MVAFAESLNSPSMKASFGGALRRPFGLPPFIDRHFYTSGCGEIYRSQMSHLTVPHPTNKLQQHARTGASLQLRAT